MNTQLQSVWKSLSHFLLISSLAAAPAVAQLNWVQRADVPTLTTATSATAYDSNRSRVMLFNAGALSEWDGGVWVARVAATQPTVGTSHAMTYDSIRSRLVLLVSDQNLLTSSIWEWSGTNWVGPQAAPFFAPDAALAFDPTRARTMLLVGQQMWEWDGASWSQPMPAMSPSARTGYGLTYDSSRQRIVLFGGGTCGQMLDDQWEWDGSTWTPVSQPATRPAPRAGQGLAYDSARQKLILFGGTIDCQANGETWEWDGSTWTPAAPGGPGARTGVGLLYDPTRQRTVLVGGATLFDTWEWDGAAWSLVASWNGPLAGTAYGLVYDSSRQQAYTFDMFARQAWRWDGAAWSSFTFATLPTPYTGYATVFDPMNNRTMLFGGFNSGHVESSETWVWDGTDWQRVVPTRSPTRRSLCTMAFDSGRNRIVLYGNADHLQDTWEWDGTTWSGPFGIVHPRSFRAHGMAYDPIGGGILLFGGAATGGFIDETWRWDGANWTQLFPAHHPSARALIAMTTDRARQRIVLFGGSDQTQGVNDLWEWDGSDWIQVATPTQPPGREGVEMVFDSARQNLLMFGGANPVPQQFNDTWELTTRPTGVFPPSGREAGDDVVTVQNVNGTTIADTRVLFGETPATVLAVAPDHVTVRTPAGTGAVDVVVANSRISNPFPAGFTYVDAAMDARYGNVNVALGARENVLLVNGGFGIPIDRTLSLPIGAPITVQMQTPSSRVTSTFALYAWGGIPNAGTLGVLPRGVGSMVFRLPFQGGPTPAYIWNNLGHFGILGNPTLPAAPAPTIVVNRPNGAHGAVNATLQGLIVDDASQIPQHISVTNAVILRVH
ncbi:MAG: IPT/TIG domain-containing protein [Planctomycetes bacterium]|nr:IPT/TIG domain-containing protein [Planctomycetota bacterium]MBI3848404.1 IPT/TIG domain-containing protein [Planctomycetota bacterium]